MKTVMLIVLITLIGINHSTHASDLNTLDHPTLRHRTASPHSEAETNLLECKRALSNCIESESLDWLVNFNDIAINLELETLQKLKAGMLGEVNGLIQAVMPTQDNFTEGYFSENHQLYQNILIYCAIVKPPLDEICPTYYYFIEFCRFYRHILYPHDQQTQKAIDTIETYYYMNIEDKSFWSISIPSTHTARKKIRSCIHQCKFIVDTYFSLGLPSPISYLNHILWALSLI